MNTYALILAGGSGTRFWPLSRNARPKQLLNLFGGDTLIEQTVERLDGFVPPENILILTNHLQVEGIRELLGDRLPPENIVAEPDKRDTAPAIALAIGWVAARDPDAVMVVLPADHLIQDVGAFQNVLRGAAQAAATTEALVTVGIKPTWACPGYGYVERAEPADIEGMPEGIEVYDVARFREKPDPELAQQFVDAGNYTWNAGMFIWSLPTVRKELGQHCPELAGFIDELGAAKDFAGLVADKFSTLTKVSIDYALMENAARVLNIEATFDWDDVGSWISVAKYLDADGNDNRSNHVLTQIDAKDNIIFSREPHHIALLGVEDLIVVQTGDALLIANRHQADAIKKLTDLVPEELL